MQTFNTPFKVLGLFSPPAIQESVDTQFLPIIGPIETTNIENANQSVPFYYLCYEIVFTVNWNTTSTLFMGDPVSASGSFAATFTLPPENENEPNLRICKSEIVFSTDNGNNIAIAGVMEPFQCEKLFAFFELVNEEVLLPSAAIMIVLIFSGDYEVPSYYYNNFFELGGGITTVNPPVGDPFNLNYKAFVTKEYDSTTGSVSVESDVEYYVFEP